MSPGPDPERTEPWWTWIVAVFAGVVVAQLAAVNAWPPGGWAVRSLLAAAVVVATALLLPRLVAWARP